MPYYIMYVNSVIYEYYFIYTDQTPSRPECVLRTGCFPEERKPKHSMMTSLLAPAYINTMGIPLCMGRTFLRSTLFIIWNKDEDFGSAD